MISRPDAPPIIVVFRAGFCPIGFSMVIRRILQIDTHIKRALRESDVKTANLDLMIEDAKKIRRDKSARCQFLLRQKP